MRTEKEALTAAHGRCKGVSECSAGHVDSDSRFRFGHGSLLKVSLLGLARKQMAS
jgi:hypothetical protein